MKDLYADYTKATKPYLSKDSKYCPECSNILKITGYIDLMYPPNELLACILCKLIYFKERNEDKFSKTKGKITTAIR